MRLSAFFAIAAVATLLALNVAPAAVAAEQIRLADGRFLQGDVVEVKEDGFSFKLTDGGGKVFLRWNQVDAGLKERLKNEKDPDAGLNLEVTVAGARLELLDGTVHQGNIVKSGNNYVVTNRDRKNLQVAVDDVAEDGYITGIQIDATVMMTEKEALAGAEEARAPLDTAAKYYEMARIADRLGLYEEAKEYVTNALQTSPDTRLQARLTEYDNKLAELIRQKELLIALGAARQLAKKNQYQTALDHLKTAKDTHKPVDAVLAQWEQVAVEIDLEFYQFVISEWFKSLKPVVQAKFKEKDSRDMTVAQAMTWARREMDVAIQERLAAMVGSQDPAGIKARFMQRHMLADTNWDNMSKVALPSIGRTIGDVPALKGMKPFKLSTYRASFGEDGYYTIIDGNLPVAGQKPQPTSNQPNNNNQPGGRRGPSGNNGNGSNGNNGNQGSQQPGNWDGDSDGFQDEPRMPTPEEIAEALRRIGGGKAPDSGESSDETKGPGKQDHSKLKIPATVPSLNEWWDKAPRGTRVSWLVALYVTQSGTMRLVDRKFWDYKYR